MEKEIIELTLREISELPEKVKKRIGYARYCLVLDGIKYYGFTSAKQIHKFLKPQRGKRITKII